MGETYFGPKTIIIHIYWYVDGDCTAVVAVCLIVLTHHTTWKKSIIKSFVKKPESPSVHQPSEPCLNTARRGPGRPRNQPIQDPREQTNPKTMQEPSHQMRTRSRGAQITADRGHT